MAGAGEAPAAAAVAGEGAAAGRPSAPPPPANSCCSARRRTTQPCRTEASRGMRSTASRRGTSWRSVPAAEPAAAAAATRVHSRLSLREGQRVRADVCECKALHVASEPRMHTILNHSQPLRTNRRPQHGTHARCSSAGLSVHSTIQTRRPRLSSRISSAHHASAAWKEATRGGGVSRQVKRQTTKFGRPRQGLSQSDSWRAPPPSAPSFWHTHSSERTRRSPSPSRLARQRHSSASAAASSTHSRRDSSRSGRPGWARSAALGAGWQARLPSVPAWVGVEEEAP